MGMRELLSGNEAIALGAYHAGVAVAAAYPGTPSTEILENLAHYPGLYAEWSPNEKVALEVALGASYAGVRALASMKHVGLNVAADPFFAASVTGVRGGLVVVSADDPGMHSSQSEQDNRQYAKFAKVPLLEPSDSQEAYELTRLAFQISEEFDTPVLLRSSTRVSHAKSVVEYEDALPIPSRRAGFQRDFAKFVMIPAHARRRHPLMEERVRKLAAFAEGFPYNRIIWGEKDYGIVSSGIAYHYAREAFPGASFLKLTLSYPLPEGLVRKFASGVERVVVVEELDPFLEEALRAMGLEVTGKAMFPLVGELNVERVREGGAEAGLGTPSNVKPTPISEISELPRRPPVLCPGCPHRGLYAVLKRMGFFRGRREADGTLPSGQLIATGDIGCYTLGVLPPLAALDTCACMGASIGQAMGLRKAGVANPLVAVIGDSTFMHSGITGLLDVAYNQGRVTVIVLDNQTTAMTGHQDHPGTGITAQGLQTRAADPVAIARAVGIEMVRVVGAFDLEKLEGTLRECLEHQGPSVVVVRSPCILLERSYAEALRVEGDLCTGCGLCLSLGCPAIYCDDEDIAHISPTLCVGTDCGVCLQICPPGAIITAEEGN